MNDNRPTKKQRELLSFIDGFIKGSGYGPSYREVMRALDYRSVSTVATHIDGLIMRGYLRKTDNSARSLQVVSAAGTTAVTENSHLVWLQREIATRRSSDDPVQQAEADTLEAARLLLDQTPNRPV